MRDLGSGIVLRQGGDRCWLEYRAVAMDNAFSTVPIGSVGDIPRAVEQIAKIADVMDDFRVDRLGLVAAVADILTPWFAEREAQSNSESTCEACPSPAVIQLSYTRWRCGDCYEKFCDGRLTQYYEDLDRDRRDIALAPIARALGDPHGPIYGLDRVDCKWCGQPAMLESEYCGGDCIEMDTDEECYHCGAEEKLGTLLCGARGQMLCKPCSDEESRRIFVEASESPVGESESGSAVDVVGAGSQSAGLSSRTTAGADTVRVGWWTSNPENHYGTIAHNRKQFREREQAKAPVGKFAFGAAEGRPERVTPIVPRNAVSTPSGSDDDLDCLCGARVFEVLGRPWSRFYLETGELIISSYKYELTRSRLTQSGATVVKTYRMGYPEGQHISMLWPLGFEGGSTFGGAGAVEGDLVWLNHDHDRPEHGPEICRLPFELEGS